MDLRARLATLIAVRVVVSTLLLGSGVLVQLSRPDALPATPYFYLIAAAYAMSILNLMALRAVDAHKWVADAQLGGDALLVTAFITVTGGVTSVFSSLYLLPVIAASTIRGRRGALQVAVLSALVFCAVVLWQYQGSEYFALIAEPGPLPPVRQAQYTVGINLFGFVAVALVSGALADNARTADARFARASVQMADLRAFNAHVVDSLLSGLATTDAGGRVLTFNRAARTITGLGPEAVAGREAAEVLQLPEACLGELRALQEGQSLRLDLVYRTPARGVIDLGLSVTTLVFPDAARGWLFTFQDVTDMRRLERDARLRQRLAAVGEMAAGIAHEIRNPLASMSGSIQVLRSELTLNAEQSELMDIVLREVDRLNGLVTDLLEYARPRERVAQAMDLAALMAETVRVFSQDRSHPGVQVKMEPEPVGEVLVNADAAQI
ncbi:MAG: histidine kinase dimerization/phospho-acceptor domain-containing protein, partial [Vicinamibacterales bacterium]|nr:histidine kinase dimerization/phospho-acceptor domain-containing protein [Vicinamibacterales bacterium]